jgi:hypothetical protein
MSCHQYQKTVESAAGHTTALPVNEGRAVLSKGVFSRGAPATTLLHSLQHSTARAAQHSSKHQQASQLLLALTCNTRAETTLVQLLTALVQLVTALMLLIRPLHTLCSMVHAWLLWCATLQDLMLAGNFQKSASQQHCCVIKRCCSCFCISPVLVANFL